MAKLVNFTNSTPSTEEKLIADIKAICVGNPHSQLAQLIAKRIDSSIIPMQMDKDLMRRLTDPVCNPLDLNFQLPLSALAKQYDSNY